MAAAPAAVLALARWHNGVIAALGVLAGAWWAARDASSARTIAAALAALPLAAFANTVNDLHDVAIDRVAHPGRPLASGVLSRRAAIVVAFASALLALAASAAAGLALGAASALVLAAMALYSTHLKNAGVAGNLTVALLASLPFLYGAWSVGRPLAALPLLAIAMPLHLARELAKDLDDVEGDRLHRRTLPVARGVAVARRACLTATFLALAALVPLMLHSPAFAIAVVPAVALSAAAGTRVLRGRRGGALLFKSAMVCAMLSLLAARP